MPERVADGLLVVGFCAVVAGLAGFAWQLAAIAAGVMCFGAVYAARRSAA